MTREEAMDRLTEYVLGELTPDERAAIERLLETDADLCAERDEIREAVALVSACATPCPTVKQDRLAMGRVDAILSRIVTSPRPRRRLGSVIPVSTAAAAAFFAVLAYTGSLGPTRGERAMAERLADAESRLETLRNTGGRMLTVQERMLDPVPFDYRSLESSPHAPLDSSVGSARFPVLDDFTASPPTAAEYFLQGRSNRYDTRLRRLDAVKGELNTNIPDFPLGTRLRSPNRIEELRRILQERIGGRRVENLRDFDVQICQDAAIADPLVDTEEYDPLIDNPFARPLDVPLSTFSIDVDTASYANVRRFLRDGQLPPPDAVRLEELVNYFHYAYVPPAGAEPFSLTFEAHAAPWEPRHQLVRIGIQGKEIERQFAPTANLVFLVDVSGSMDEEDKLPLVQSSLALLTESLRAQDKVAIVVYAGAAGVVLPPTSGALKQEIVSAVGRLKAGGSTNGAQGIELAYQLAADNFVKDGVNRVILCTDGDFNVGVTSEGDLGRMIEKQSRTGVFLSVLGFGRGNYADARMQVLAQTGNGNAAYIDSLQEARKVLVEQATGTLIAIAKDVKIQVEFNPAKVAAYRLIGYENRLLAAQDFNDDRKDAGEIGAGHQVTALYEVIPAGIEVPTAIVDELRYQKPATVVADGAAAGELCTVKLRYKASDGDTSRKLEFCLTDPGLDVAGASLDFQFAASVAAFAMCLRDSEYKGRANFGLVRELAIAGLGDDALGYRREFVELVKKAGELTEAMQKASEEKK